MGIHEHALGEEWPITLHNIVLEDVGGEQVSASGISRKAWKNEDGQTLILAALCLAILMGGLALAVDVGLLFCAKQTAQTAADAAVIAAAQEIPFGDTVTAARADAATNGYTNGQNGVTVAVNNPPLSGPHSGDSGYAEVIVSAPKKSYFLNVFNIPSTTIEARAVAELAPTDNCIYALDPTGTDISMGNNATINLSGCALYADSSSSSALNTCDGGGGATLTAAAINLVGGYTGSNCGSSITPSTPTTGVGSVSDPLGYLQPPQYNSANCTSYSNGGSGITVPLSSAGCYSSLTVSYGTATLTPGLYVITKSFSLGGGASVTGTGVTIYLAPNASMSLNSGGNNFQFTAPTSGAWNGILFYQDRSNTTAESLEGGSTSYLQGILYFPSANLTFGNGSSTSAYESQTYASVIANTLTFQGGSTVQNYAIKNPGTPLASPRLVE